MEKKHEQHGEWPIEHFEFGQFIICGEEHSGGGGKRKGAGKDIRLIGEKVTSWKERKGHVLLPEQVTGVFRKGIEVLVIGNGEDQALQVSEKVLESIRARGIGEVIVAATPQACSVYNRLHNAGKKAALLAHGTC